jgi:hypothetical protein
MLKPEIVATIPSDGLKPAEQSSKYPGCTEHSLYKAYPESVDVSDKYKTEDTSERPSISLRPDNFVGVSEKYPGLPEAIVFFDLRIRDDQIFVPTHLSFALCYQRPTNQTEYQDKPHRLAIYQINDDGYEFIKGVDVFDSNSHHGTLNNTEQPHSKVDNKKLGQAILGFLIKDTPQEPEAMPIVLYPGVVSLSFGRDDLPVDYNLFGMISRGAHITFELQIDEQGNVVSLTATDRSLNGTTIYCQSPMSLESTQPIPQIVV